MNKITLSTWRTDPGSDSDGSASTYAFGLVLPPDALTKDADEYIGLLVRCPPQLTCFVMDSTANTTSSVVTLMRRAPDGVVSPTASQGR